jgi:hypothetical protein
MFYAFINILSGDLKASQTAVKVGRHRKCTLGTLKPLPPTGLSLTTAGW